MTRAAGIRCKVARHVTVQVGSTRMIQSKPVFDFKKATPENITDKCLTCHASGSEHISASNSFHRQNDVACTSCHSMHHAKDKRTHADQIGARALLFVPPTTEGSVQYAVSSSRKRRADFVHRLHNQHGTGGVLEGDHLVRQAANLCQWRPGLL